MFSLPDSTLQNPSKNSNFREIFQWVTRTVRICHMCGIPTTFTHSETFFTIRQKSHGTTSKSENEKNINFCQVKTIHLLKLGCNWRKLTNNCLDDSTATSFCPFPERDYDLLEKVSEKMVDLLLVFSASKNMVGETRFRFSSSVCKSIVHIDASQLYPYAKSHASSNGHEKS